MGWGIMHSAWLDLFGKNTFCWFPCCHFRQCLFRWNWPTG